MLLIIYKIIALSGSLTTLQCTKIHFRGSAPDPAGGAQNASPDPLAGGPTNSKEEGRGKGGGGIVKFCMFVSMQASQPASD